MGDPPESEQAGGQNNSNEKSEKSDASKKDKGGKGKEPRARYPLRVDVAKPAVVYQPSFEKLKPSPVKSATANSPGGSGSGGGGGSTPKERILGKRRRSGRTEFLVKRSGVAESQWELSKNVSASAVQEFEEKRQSRQLLQSRLASAKQAKQGGGTSASVAEDSGEVRVPYRILAGKRFEGGQRYLVHWAGQSVTNASWEPTKRLNNPALVAEFEAAVSRRPKRARLGSLSLSLLSPLSLPPVCLCEALGCSTATSAREHASGGRRELHTPSSPLGRLSISLLSLSRSRPPLLAPHVFACSSSSSSCSSSSSSSFSSRLRTGEARALDDREPAGQPHALFPRLPQCPRLPGPLLPQPQRHRAPPHPHGQHRAPAT